MKVIPEKIIEHCVECPYDPMNGGECHCSILSNCPLKDFKPKKETHD